MSGFKKNTRGAVTVFVTLLLIPAMLVSGTAVDLARIHSTHSILQDANQLAANSVLTQYNALLYDLYGVMGVAQDDPIFASLLSDYISVAVYGEARDTLVGSLQIFYGTDLSVSTVDFPDGQNLRNADVLRRQIEEYMKFRGPVLIVKQLIEKLQDNKIKEDTEAIAKKCDIDQGIADMYEKYKELYEAILAADKCDQVNGGIAGGTVGTVSSRLTAINTLFSDLSSCYSTWERQIMQLDAEPGDTEESQEKIESLLRKIASSSSKYDAIRRNISASVIGGSIGESWSGGSWSKYSTTQGLNVTVSNAKTYADEKGKPKFDEVVRIARELDAMNDELRKKVDDLEYQLNQKNCSDEFYNGFMKESGTPPKTIIQRYRDVLKWNYIEAMAKTYKTGGYAYIDDVLKPLLEGVKYRKDGDVFAGSMSRTALASLPSDRGFSLQPDVSAEDSLAAYYAAFPKDSVAYKMPTGFRKFSDYPGNNKAFWDELTAMMTKEADPIKLYDGQKDESGKNAQEKQQNIIDSVLKIVEEAYTGLTNDPLGADYVKDSLAPKKEKMGLLQIGALLKQALNSPFIKAIFDPVGSLVDAGDYLLLLVYCTSMFSNYTTTRPDSIGKTMAEKDEIKFTKSITGAKISPEVNYFFQSEWEYLYKGEQNAAKNLNVITGLLFTVRLLCNYITVFTVSEVTSIVTSIQASFAANPPLGIILGELARGAFVAAESLVDVARLRSGHKLPLVKNAEKGEWVCSPSGIMTAMQDVVTNVAATGSGAAGGVADGAADGSGSSGDASASGSGETSASSSGSSSGEGGGEDTGKEGAEEEKKEKGFSYEEYMYIFFLSKALTDANAADELASRTANLIEWNVINFKEGINADEEKMEEALNNEDRFQLVNMKTDISITTTANMHMLFLSMPFAARGANGIIPPATLPVTVTDYRGY